MLVHVGLHHELEICLVVDFKEDAQEDEEESLDRQFFEISWETVHGRGSGAY